MSEIRVDTISEKTSANGVTIDGLTIKDGGITATTGAIVFNEASADVDFRVESNDIASMFFVNGGTNKVGVGLDDPTGTFHVKSTDAGTTMFIEDTHAGGGDGPELYLYRNSASPAANDDTGIINFLGKNDAGQDVNYVQIKSIIKDATDGQEDGKLELFHALNGALTPSFQITPTEIVLNESSNDLDFRVESNGDTHALFVDGGNNRVSIGTASPDYTLTVRSMGSPSNDSIINIVGNSTDANCGVQFTNSAGTLRGRLSYDTDDNIFITTVNAGEASRYLSGRELLIGQTASMGHAHESGNIEKLGVLQSESRYSLYLNNSNASFGSYLQRNDAERAAHSGYGFFIGSSGNESDNEIRMMGDGSINSDGSNNLGSGADYAEYFEWKDGNSSDEDRRGYSVVLDGNQIVKATDSDDASKIIGVISGNPSVVGDSAWNKWNQKHLKDDFNTYIWEDYTQTEWTDSDGNFISHQTDLIPDGVTAPDDAVVVSKEEDGTTNLQRRKVNPSWDSTATYVPRSDRKEWDTVGLMGKLRLLKGQPTGTNWIKMRDISDTVEEWLVR